MDDALRTLARQLKKHAAPTERLRASRAFLRAGDADAALEALLPACDDGDVRKELASHPGWTHAEACAGQTACADVRGIERSPDVLWVSDPRPERDRFQLLASPVAILRASAERVSAFHPETGSLLWTRTVGLSRAFAISGETLLVASSDYGDAPSRLETLSLESGETLDRTTIPGRQVTVRAAGRIWSLPTAAGCGILKVASATIASAGPEAETTLTATDDLLLVSGAPERLNAFDSKTGARLWDAVGRKPRLDRRGAVALFGDDLMAFDHRGRARRLASGVRAIAALTPRSVVITRGEVLGIDRDSGVESKLGELGWVVAARETVYVGWLRRVRGATTTGERIFDIEVPGHVAAMAPLTRRLYVADLDGSITCLG